MTLALTLTLKDGVQHQFNSILFTSILFTPSHELHTPGSCVHHSST